MKITSMKKRLIAVLCIIALLFAGQTEINTAGAAGKIKVFHKFPKVKRNFNLKRCKAACNICKYKGKLYIYCPCVENDKKTYYEKHPTSKAEKAGYGEKSLTKTVFKGRPIWISGTSRSMIMELGEKESYQIKVKKGVKIIAIGSCTKKGYDFDGMPYCHGSTEGPFVKLTSVSKNKITLKAVKEASEEYIPLQIYFKYKGQRYFYNSVLVNRSGDPIGWNVIKETEE